MQVSVIVTLDKITRTVESLQALKAVLFSLNCQTIQDFEIIVADVRATDEVALYLKTLEGQLSVPLHHVWRKGEGLSRSAAKNQAILQASSEYLVFLESDCIPSVHFVANHRALAECGRMVIGKRIMLSKDFSREVLSKHLPVREWSLRDWLNTFFLGNCYCLLPMATWLWKEIRYALPLRWQGAKGYNLGVWKSDLFRVNGWEESLSGGDVEDRDLIIRLLRTGVKGKSGRGRIPVFHCWHENPKKVAQQQTTLSTEGEIKPKDAVSCRYRKKRTLFSIKGLSHHAELL